MEKIERDRDFSPIKGIFGLFNLVTLILLIVWLFKIINNSKNEPLNYAVFVSNETLVNYTEGDFCYGRKYEYLKRGAFQLFNIKMKKIKKFAKALLASKFISIGTFFFIGIVNGCYRKCKDTSICFFLLFCLIYIANNILNVIFMEKLNSYYRESNFYDFEKFSKCAYIQTTFKRSYKFMKTVDKNCKKIFVVNFISAILEAISIN